MLRLHVIKLLPQSLKIAPAMLVSQVFCCSLCTWAATVLGNLNKSPLESSPELQGSLALHVLDDELRPVDPGWQH